MSTRFVLVTLFYLLKIVLLLDAVISPILKMVTLSHKDVSSLFQVAQLMRGRASVTLEGTFITSTQKYLHLLELDLKPYRQSLRGVLYPGTHFMGALKTVNVHQAERSPAVWGGAKHAGPGTAVSDGEA